MAFVASMCACTNTASPDDFDDYSSSSKKVVSSSSLDKSTCKLVKESLASPTKFDVFKDSDTSWTFSWEYSRNDERPETGFLIESLDMDADSPDWKREGSTNAEVTLYKLHGKSKVGKYYRVMAIDDCGMSNVSNRLQINENGSTSVSTASESNLGVPSNFAITDTLGENRWLVSWSYSGDRDSYVLQRFIDKKNKWEKFLTIDDGTALETVVDTNAAGMYIRVAAVYEGKVSTYSSKIKIPNAVVKTATSSGAASSGGTKTNCTGTLASPTNLAATRVAPSVWQLSWKYQKTSTCPESGFLVQSLDLKSDNPVWKDVKKTAEDVFNVYLNGEKFRGLMYRVVALNGDKKSEWSNQIEVTTKTPYSDEFEFTTPTLIASIYKAASGYEMRLVVTKNFPNEALLTSSYTKSVEYEFRWGGSAEDTPNEKIDVSKTSVITKFKSTENKELCSSYGQVRTIWTDVNGKTEVTEWSMPVGSLSGFNSGLGDSEKLCPFVYDEGSSSSSAE